VENDGMELNGLVQNGVIVLSGGVTLPEGTPVTVTCGGDAPAAQSARRRIQVPLVHTGRPGSMNLNNDRIAEIFNEEDVASARC
jgi:hypothetical protein